MPHYGKLEEILVVSYDAHSKFEEYVFKCKWFKMNLAGANCTVLGEKPEVVLTTSEVDDDHI